MAQVDDTSPPDTAETDILNTLAGIAPGSALAATRALRPDVVRHTQGSYDALLTPAEPVGLTLAERAKVALRVARLEGNATLADHYRHQLTQLDVHGETIAGVEQFPAGPTLEPRVAAILQHVDRLTNEPGSATQAHLAALQAHGLSVREIVTLSQLIAFLSFQVRVLATVNALAEGTVA